MNSLLIDFALMMTLAATHATPPPAQFDPNRLSARGRTAYETILRADVFGFGSFGKGGGISDAETALFTLTQEPEAVAALAGLARTANPAGRLYALSGLTAVDRTRFLLEAGRLDRKTLAAGVTTISGCIVTERTVSDVVEEIGTGQYDEYMNERIRTLAGA